MHRLTLIAETGARFGDFGPYVASLNDAGTVAFHAMLSTGSTGVFLGEGTTVTVAAEGHRFCSHPDVDREGRVAVYTKLPSGGDAVVLAEAGRVTTLADTRDVLSGIGPLGPTIGDRGEVAFRADSRTGGSGIFLASHDAITMVADGGTFVRFHGLPVLNRRGLLVFRGDRKDGQEGIYAFRHRQIEPLVVTGPRFSTLASFPSVNDDGSVVFTAKLARGGEGVFHVTGDHVKTIVDITDFESFRGALINNRGTVFFYATRGGRLGIYAGPDPERHHVLSLNDEAFGSTVIDLALNPVSVNDSDQLAIRMGLADGRQIIARADPHAA